MNSTINEQRFIDINIDSDPDDAKQSSAEPKNKKTLFNFRNKSKKKTDDESKTPTTTTTIVENSTNSLTLHEATDILLSNLNELNLNYYSDDHDDDEDDDDDLNENNLKLKTDNNLFKLHQKLQKLESLNSDLDLHSTPLRSKSSNSIDNENDVSLNCSSYSSDNRTLSDTNKNDVSLSKKSSIGLNQKDLISRFNARNNLVNLARNDSIVDGLLGDIYDRFNVSFKESFDSDVFTEISMSSTRFSGTESRSCIDSDRESESRFYFKNSIIAKSSLKHLSLNDLRDLVNEMNSKVNQISAKLIRQLRQKDKLASKLNRNCDILTALLQAKSLKRRVDTKMKFTLDPMPGEAGFAQWKDAMKALTRLPGGIPKEFRKSVWLNLAHKYIRDISLDWNKVRRIAFNDRSNPDDDELGIQIVKDLHRTGCSTFSGDDNEQDRALLKRVLLAFARYNKSIGYCQGFNIIAALILEIVDKKEEDALICMIYLIDHILPEGYFTNSMHSLAIDMAVFRELLKTKLPKLCQHLNNLQFASDKKKISNNNNLNRSKSAAAITNYEPPLTNVFTMQWFLTLFATCLPKNVLLRVWDCIFLEGAEILFRTSIAIWDKLSVSVMKAQSADAFYSMMSILTIKLFDQNVIDENDLVSKIYSYGSFPLSGIEELREKFTFSIQPFQMFGLQQQKNNDNSKTGGLSNLKLNNIQHASASTGNLISTAESTTSNEVENADLKTDLANLNKSEEFSLSLRGMTNNSKLNSNSNKKTSEKKIENEDDEFDDEVEDLAKMISCFALLMPNRSVTQNASTSATAAATATRNDIMMTAAAAASTYGGMIGNNSAFKAFTKTFSKQTEPINLNKIETKDDISKVTPGAFSYITQMYNPKPLEEHLTLDLNELKKQYKKLKERQRQAHIIIQTASSQHRQKTASNNINSSVNKPSPSNIPQTRLLTKSESFNMPSITNEPIVNHLLIKPNDPTCNILKKPIQINTESSNHMVTDSLSNDPFINYVKTEVARNSSIESYEKEIIEKKKEEISKKKKVYYSDDEEDDDDDDDDDDVDVNDDENQEITENDDSFELVSKETKNETNSNYLTDTIQFNKAKSLTLLDLSNLNESNSKLDNTLSVNKELSSSSSSSSFGSPQQCGDISKDVNNNYACCNDFSLTNNLQTTTQINPKPKTTKMITSSIILNLANEEKRHMTPLNPFPTRHINSNVAKNGMRLGLYK